jgi:hypothetical protein
VKIPGRLSSSEVTDVNGHREGRDAIQEPRIGRTTMSKKKTTKTASTRRAKTGKTAAPPAPAPEQTAPAEEPKASPKRSALAQLPQLEENVGDFSPLL